MKLIRTKLIEEIVEVDVDPSDWEAAIDEAIDSIDWTKVDKLTLRTSNWRIEI